VEDHPILACLGRRGRWSVAHVLGAQPTRTWNLRELAGAAGVHPVVAGRAVRELAALVAVDLLRPRRDAQVRLRLDTPAGAFVAALQPPDLRGDTEAIFAAAYTGPGPVVRWSRKHAGDPEAPTRLAIVVGAGKEDAAWEAVDGALDAVRAAGLPAPDVSVLAEPLDASDDVARAVAEAVTQTLVRTLGRGRRAGDPGVA
jgi:hypothetical protein